jgi:hypothetical protein
MKSSPFTKDLVALSGLFGPTFLNTLLHEKLGRNVGRVVDKSLKSDYSGKKLSTVLEYAYEFLQSGYRCEYVYKNTIANKILLGRHSINSSLLLTEFRAGTSMADIVILNGTSSVYEIKTELDNLDRLETQIAEYLKIFDRVHVVTYDNNAPKVSNMLPKRVGILVLSNRNQLQVYRESKSNKRSIDPDFIFDSLRRDEYVSIINQVYGYTPRVPNTMIYTVCKKLFRKIAPHDAHDLAVASIRKSRALKEAHKRLVLKATPAVRMMLLSRVFGPKHCTHLHSVLSSKL